MRALVFLIALLMTASALFSGIITGPIETIYDYPWSSNTTCNEIGVYKSCQSSIGYHSKTRQIIEDLSENTYIKTITITEREGSNRDNFSSNPNYSSDLREISAYEIIGIFESGTTTDPNLLPPGADKYEWTAFKRTDKEFYLSIDEEVRCILEKCTVTKWGREVIDNYEELLTTWWLHNAHGPHHGYNLTVAPDYRTKEISETSYFIRPTDVPEPSTMAFAGLGLGLMCLAFVRR